MRADLAVSQFDCGPGIQRDVWVAGMKKQTKKLLETAAVLAAETRLMLDVHTGLCAACTARLTFTLKEYDELRGAK